MSRRGIVMISRLGGMALPLNEELSQSPYGDPELAMLYQESPEDFEDNPAPKPKSDRVDELFKLLGYLCERDRALMAMHQNGATQVEIGERLDLRQPSVCFRIQTIEEWIRHVLPMRMMASGIELPPEFSEERKKLWDMLVWQHRSQVYASKQLGRTQGWARYHFHRMVYDLMPPDHPLVELGRYIVEKGHGKWLRPRDGSELGRRRRLHPRKGA